MALLKPLEGEIVITAIANKKDRVTLTDKRIYYEERFSETSKTCREVRIIPIDKVESFFIHYEYNFDYDTKYMFSIFSGQLAISLAWYYDKKGRSFEGNVLNQNGVEFVSPEEDKVFEFLNQVQNVMEKRKLR